MYELQMVLVLCSDGLVILGRPFFIAFLTQSCHKYKHQSGIAYFGDVSRNRRYHEFDAFHCHHNLWPASADVHQYY